jgi:hypothetical protein
MHTYYKTYRALYIHITKHTGHLDLTSLNLKINVYEDGVLTRETLAGTALIEDTSKSEYLYLCVCMYVCMCVFVCMSTAWHTHTHTRIDVIEDTARVSIYMYPYIIMYVCVCMYSYIQMQMCMFQKCTCFKMVDPTDTLLHI